MRSDETGNGMVHGNPFGARNRDDPDMMKSCGTFFALRYFWIAAFGEVPNEPTMARTSSPSTRRRVCSTVFGALKPSSSESRLIFLPLTPPASLTFRSNACVAPAIGIPMEETAPLYGRVCPSLISVSVTPGPYCGPAMAMVAARNDATTGNTKAAFTCWSPRYGSPDHALRKSKSYLVPHVVSVPRCQTWGLRGSVSCQGLGSNQPNSGMKT